MRIVFMGTPDFAVESLKKLVETGHQMVGVVTAPDKPAGRGRKLNISPVKGFAQKIGLEIFQPTNLKDPEWIRQLQSLKPDLLVVVAFRMLPEVVWSLPPKGTINLHASLLPQYRGAAPINWAIINGEKETGATTFFINQNIDTGAIIEQVKVPILPEDTAGSLHDKLMVSGAELLQHTVKLIAKGEAHAQLQPESGELKHAPKIFKENIRIDFEQAANRVYDFIRGMAPYPAATSILKMRANEFPLKIFATSIIEQSYPEIGPGILQTDHKKYLHVKCKTGTLAIETLQIAGKKRMDIGEFLNGFEILEGSRLL